MDLIDAKGVIIDGECVTVKLIADTITTPHDADGYSPADIERWNAEDWRYVGVVVETEDDEESLWGVEYGAMPGCTITFQSILTETYAGDETLPQELFSIIKSRREA